MSVIDKSREELAEEADKVRSKLLRTVEQLDQRRHDALDLGKQLERHLRQVAILGGLVLLATTSAVAVVVHRVSTAAQRRRRHRWILARDVWQHPERAMRGRRPSVFGQLGRSLLVSLAGSLLMIPARRAITLLLEQGPAPTRGPRYPDAGTG